MCGYAEPLKQFRELKIIRKLLFFSIKKAFTDSKGSNSVDSRKVNPRLHETLNDTIVTTF